MEKKRTAGAVAGAALVAAVVGEMLRRSGYSTKVQLRRIIRAQPRAIIDLVREVDREPELIPCVKQVTVLEGGPDGVRYRLEGTSPLGSWWAEYHKWWDYTAGTIGWASDRGAFGLRQRGRMNLEEHAGATEVLLTTEYTSVTPILGPAIAASSKSLVVLPNFRTWLDNIASILESGATPPGFGAGDRQEARSQAPVPET